MSTITVPLALIQDVGQALEKFILPSTNNEYYFLTTLLNGKHTFAVNSESTENILDSVKHAWTTYFKSVDMNK